VREAFGRSRDGYGNKACVIAGGRSRAVAFVLAKAGARVAGTRVEEIEAAIIAWHKDNEGSRRLAAVPGIGPDHRIGGRRHHRRRVELHLGAALRGPDWVVGGTQQQRR
jgi:hypothetical protein